MTSFYSENELNAVFACQLTYGADYNGEWMEWSVT